MKKPNIKKENKLFALFYVLSFFAAIPVQMITYIILTFYFLMTEPSPKEVNAIAATVFCIINLIPFACLSIYSFIKKRKAHAVICIITMIAISVGYVVSVNIEKIETAIAEKDAKHISLKADTYYYIKEDVSISINKNSEGKMDEVSFLYSDGTEQDVCYYILDLDEKYAKSYEQPSYDLTAGNYLKTSKNSSISIYQLNKVEKDIFIEYDINADYPFYREIGMNELVNIPDEIKGDMLIINPMEKILILDYFIKNDEGYDDASMVIERWQMAQPKKDGNIYGLIERWFDDEDDKDKTWMVRTKTAEQLEQITSVEGEEKEMILKMFER